MVQWAGRHTASSAPRRGATRRRGTMGTEPGIAYRRAWERARARPLPARRRLGRAPEQGRCDAAAGCGWPRMIATLGAVGTGIVWGWLVSPGRRLSARAA